MLDLNYSSWGWDVVEIALRIRMFEIEGGRDLIVLHRDESGGDSCGAARTLRVADLRLER